LCSKGECVIAGAKRVSYRVGRILWLDSLAFEQKANLLKTFAMSLTPHFEDLVELGSPLDLEGGLAAMLISDGEGDAFDCGWISRRRILVLEGISSLCAASVQRRAYLIVVHCRLLDATNAGRGNWVCLVQ